MRCRMWPKKASTAYFEWPTSWPNLTMLVEAQAEYSAYSFGILLEAGGAREDGRMVMGVAAASA